jgi:hypothetical protein
MDPRLNHLLAKERSWDLARSAERRRVVPERDRSGGGAPGATSLGRAFTALVTFLRPHRHARAEQPQPRARTEALATRRMGEAPPLMMRSDRSAGTK